MDVTLKRCLSMYNSINAFLYLVRQSYTFILYKKKYVQKLWIKIVNVSIYCNRRFIGRVFGQTPGVCCSGGKWGKGFCGFGGWGDIDRLVAALPFVTRANEKAAIYKRIALLKAKLEAASAQLNRPPSVL